MEEKGIRHLDLKPANLFLDENFTLKIGDFEMASKDERKSGIQGTYFYKAPEIEELKEGGSYSTEKIDVFACGTILFFMTMCINPFCLRAAYVDKQY